MKALFDNVGDKFAMAFQALKEKTGTTQTEIDPEYQSAVEQFDIVKTRVQKFISDVNDILSMIPDICNSGVHFSQSLASIQENKEGELTDISNSFNTFFLNMQELIKSDLISVSEPAVLGYLQEVKKKFAELAELQQNRRNTQLLCDSFRDKLSRISASGSPNEVAEVKYQYEAKQNELKVLTDKFKNEMKIVWEQRFNILDVPFQQFVSLIYLFCQQSYSHLQELQKNVTKEELMKDYPVSNQ